MNRPVVALARDVLKGMSLLDWRSVPTSLSASGMKKWAGEIISGRGFSHNPVNHLTLRVD